MWATISGWWDKFIFGFCKVEFLCWNGEPNWLGCLVLSFFVGLVVYSAERVSLSKLKYVRFDDLDWKGKWGFVFFLTSVLWLVLLITFA